MYFSFFHFQQMVREKRSFWKWNVWPHDKLLCTKHGDYWIWRFHSFKWVYNGYIFTV